MDIDYIIEKLVNHGVYSFLIVTNDVLWCKHVLTDVEKQYNTPLSIVYHKNNQPLDTIKYDGYYVIRHHF